MSTFISFVVSLLSTIIWLIALLSTIPIVLYFANKALLIKLLNKIANFVISKRENKKGKKPVSPPKPGNNNSVHENDQSKEKLNLSLKKISELQQQTQLMDKTSKERDETIIQLQHQLLKAQSELYNVISKKAQEETKKSNDKIEAQIPLNKPHLLYAYAPTSSSPYGFAKEDWQSIENGQTFVMTQISDSKASFSLNTGCSPRNILNSLAYYNRLIEYDDLTKGNGVSRIEEVLKGSLRMADGIWTIDNKIKIKLL